MKVLRFNRQRDSDLIKERARSNSSTSSMKKSVIFEKEAFRVSE